MKNPLRYFSQSSPSNNLTHKIWYKGKKKRLNNLKIQVSFRKLVQEGKKKSLGKTSLILGKIFHLKKKWIEFYRVFRQHICYVVKNKQGEKNSQTQNWNTIINFRNALQASLCKLKKKDFMGENFGTRKKIAHRILSVTFHTSSWLHFHSVCLQC